MSFDMGTVAVIAIAVVFAFVVIRIMAILARRGKAKAADASAHEYRECLSCGWSGQVSKFHKKCPNCGESIT